MLYPHNLEEKLGVSVVRDALKNKCAGKLGEKWVDNARFLSDWKLLEKLHNQTFEFVEILMEGYGFPISEYSDPTEFLEKAKIDGAVLDERELFEIKLSLGIISKSYEFLATSSPEQFVELRKLIEHVSIDTSLIKKLDQTFDNSGEIKDDATRDLRAIRLGLISESSSLRKTVQTVLRKSVDKGYTNEDSQPTIRNGRMVIPVRAENKRLVKGLIHDESSTGQTSYIEPEEAFTINNRLRELYAKEKREIFRILSDITSKVRENAFDLDEAYKFLGKIDFIRAKADLAIDFRSFKPKVIGDTIIELDTAYHPILWLSQRDKKEIKPVSVKLDKNQRVILISGPNAGGKSVTLKTIGLLQFLFQCGIPVPVGEQTKFGVFKDVFVDMGDEQSLENELSTYSAHLNNMHVFLQKTNKNSLFLIDEFGTGTEPEYGGAMAESILRRLHEKGSYGVITTHYSNLKEFAEKTEGMENAAMLYDVKHLSPLYEFEVGKPGSSFALEIAAKIGLDKAILDYATKKVGHQKVKYDRTLKELEQELEEARRASVELKQKEKRFQKNLSEYQELKEYLEQKKKFIVNEAKKEAKIILASANKQVENLIADIKKEGASKEVVKAKREVFEKQSAAITPSEKVKNPDRKKSEFQVIKGDIFEGDHVKLIGQETNGKVLDVKGKNVLVQVGEMRLNVKLNQLTKIKPPKENKKASKVTSNLNYIDKNLGFNPEIDIRGTRTQDALQIVDKLLDDAMVLSTKELRVVHGKGDGILRAMIRQHLDKYDFVEKVRSEHVEFGGDGVTLITLR